MCHENFGDPTGVATGRVRWLPVHLKSSTSLQVEVVVVFERMHTKPPSQQEVRLAPNRIAGTDDGRYEVGMNDQQFSSKLTRTDRIFSASNHPSGYIGSWTEICVDNNNARYVVISSGGEGWWAIEAGSAFSTLMEGCRLKRCGNRLAYRGMYQARKQSSQQTRNLGKTIRDLGMFKHFLDLDHAFQRLKHVFYHIARRHPRCSRPSTPNGQE